MNTAAKFISLIVFLASDVLETRVIARNSKSRDFLDIAFDFHQSGDFDDAIKYYRKAIKTSLSVDQLCTALHNLGFLLQYEKKNHRTAIKYLERATKLRPSYFEAYHHLGEAKHNYFRICLLQ